MQDETADEVLVQESGELGHRLVRLFRRQTVEQQAVWQHRHPKRLGRGDPAGGLDESGDGGFDGRVPGGVQRDRAGGCAATTREIGQPGRTLQVERLWGWRVSHYSLPSYPAGISLVALWQTCAPPVSVPR
jgi:hypothetical protein